MADYREKAKRYEETVNPCHKEAKHSLMCQIELGREYCPNFISNYNHCMKFWRKVIKDRIRKGIRPSIPLPEDREAVKQDYVQWLPKRYDASNSNKGPLDHQSAP